MSKIVLINDLIEGMITAEPIKNKIGVVLIPAGVELSERHKRVLKTWNVLSVNVKGDDLEENMSVTDDMKKIAREFLDHKMNWTPQNAYEKDMYNSAILYLATTIMNEQTGNRDVID